MGKQIEQEFYDRLNELDQEIRYFLIAYACVGISGGVVGFLFGYFFRAWIGGI